MRSKLHTFSPLAAAVLLAVAAAADAGGGVYMGGGGGGRGASGGGGGFGGARAGGGSGPGMSAPSANYGSRGAGPGGSPNRGNWNGGHDGNWHGGHGHGGHYYGGYYGGWWWPYWGFGLAATWPYWSGYWGDPYYYYGAPATTYYYGPPATTYYYGAPSGTIIYRSDQNATPVPQGPAIRLYCPATNQFYPDVNECSQQWLRVLPNDGAAPVPQQQPVPQSSPQPTPRSEAPASRPAYPNGASGYDLRSSSDAPTIVRASMTMAASMPVSANAAIADANASGVRHASSSFTRIPAPRATLPGRSAPGTLVAEVRAD